MTVYDPMDCSMPGSIVLHYLQSLLKFMSIESVMLSNHLILCHLFLLLLSVFSSIRVFFNELAFCIRWSKYWNFSISPSNEYSGLIFIRIDWFDLLAIQETLNSLPFIAYINYFSTNKLGMWKACSFFQVSSKLLVLKALVWQN